MAVPVFSLPASRVLKMLFGVLRQFDGLLAALATPFGVAAISAPVRWGMFVTTSAVIYGCGSLLPLEYALVALMAGWLGMLAVGRAWVVNEKRRSDIARKLIAEADPDRCPDLRILALVSALQIFVIFPMLFWRLSGPELGGALFGPINGQVSLAWWNWPLFALKQCVSSIGGEIGQFWPPDIEAKLGSEKVIPLVPGLPSLPLAAGGLLLGLQLTLDWMLLTGLLRVFAIRQTIRDVVAEAALKNDYENAVRLGVRAVRPLIRQLKKEKQDEDVQVVVAKALGDIGDDRATEILIELFDDDEVHWSVREACGEALGLIGDTKAVEPLLKSLTRKLDPELKPKVKAAKADLKVAGANVKAAEKGVAAAGKKVETAKSNVQAAEDALATAEGVLADAKDDLATAEDALATAEGVLADAKDDLATAENALATAEGVLADAKDDLATAEDALATAERALADSEEAVTVHVLLRDTVARSLGRIGATEVAGPMVERVDLFQEDIELKLQWALEIACSRLDPNTPVVVEIEYEIPVTDREIRASVGDPDDPFGLFKRERFTGEIHKVGINPDSGNGPYVTLRNPEFSKGFKSFSLSRIRDWKPAGFQARV